MREATKNETVIFETPKIKKRVENLFKSQENEIRMRFNEIMDFIRKDVRNGKRYGNIPFEDILDLFKTCFYNNILNKLEDISPEKDNCVEENILEFLSEKNLREAILGQPLIEAFIIAIKKATAKGCIIGCILLQLEEDFLGKRILY